MDLSLYGEPRLVHAIPGRIRVHLPSWPERELGAAAARLSRASGVRCARPNPLTRNLLVLFDPTVTDAAGILTSLRAPTRDAANSPDVGIAPTRGQAVPARDAMPARLPAIHASLAPPPVPSVPSVRGSGPGDLARLLGGASVALGVAVPVVNLLLSGSALGLVVNGLELLRLCGEALARREERRRAAEPAGAGAHYIVVVVGPAGLPARPTAAAFAI